ncbi:type II secretion system minor pseudopilin GspK [Massilia antarctica]|uniref:type II secretion system minor pseudopilin GspK n=1 Tax=Massilia antarctica TaxID=2765360 RepID=UPI0006BB5877|nr:type II secretion system minor pseudopilin GspK [Massilia sp. H27-R4]MCY0911911.1 type II secretion system minor pseudopilin GspK [Massilia sp. H27-R4]CUI06633.1 General secretion pathway protein K [Janthinobacterium sp. CG23_2]CUU30419.1 General secretion pathway protein K [Janthinobacterium sp. CG23_2]
MRQPYPRRQQGVAIITALLLTMLSVTIVASLFWQQQVQVRSMENQRLHLQTKWILRGALDWARLVLRQDGIDNRNLTTLNAVWNTPLAETRLDQYIERERVEGEVFDATLSGQISDATARYNLMNLSNGRVIDKVQVQVFQRLLQNLQLDPALARRTALAVASGAAPAAPVVPDPSQPAPPAPGPDDVPVPVSAGSAPIGLTQLDDLLAIPGYTQESVNRLREFAIVLPEQTKVNVNTAPAEVLAAIVEGYSVSEAAALVTRRKQAYFVDDFRFKEQLYGKDPLKNTYSFKSEYFLVKSRIRLDRAALDAEALVQRRLDDRVTTTTIWVRQN